MIFLFIAILAFFIAKKLCFFDLDWKVSGKNPIRFSHLSLAYLIYLVAWMPLPILFFQIFQPKSSSYIFFSGSSFLATVFCSTLGLLFLLSTLKTRVRTTIFGSVATPLKNWKDFRFGALSYLAIFPIAAVTSWSVNLLTQVVFPNYKLKEQVAVIHLKMLSQYPVLIGLTVLCFALIVPIIEELLFRGLLQNWLQNHLSRLCSVITASVIFSLFHFSKIQGLANIEILTTLSILGFFLGFIYEKRGSLWAPIGLHVVFNSISVTRILLETLDLF